MSTYLSQIGKKQKRKNPRFVFTGPLGVGKTWLASSALNPVFQAFEEGEGVLELKAMPKPTSYEDAMNQLAELANEKHPYKTLVVDTIDAFEPLVWDKLCEGTKCENIEQFGYGKGYTMADSLWIPWFRRLDVLRDKREMTIIILCHNETKTIDDPMIGSYTRTIPKIHKRSSALMCEWADIVGFLDIERIASDVGKKGGRETRASRTTGQRILYLEDQGAFIAKNRYDLPPKLAIPKENGFAVIRAELMKAFGLDKPKTIPKSAPKEAA